jgi:hypothetical protein
MENKNNTQSDNKHDFIKRIPFIAIAGLIIGAISGYIYYVRVGCVTGTCAITSNPWMSAGWGAVLGYLVFDMFNFRKKNNQDKVADQS